MLLQVKDWRNALGLVLAFGLSGCSVLASGFGVVSDSDGGTQDAGDGGPASCEAVCEGPCVGDVCDPVLQGDGYLHHCVVRQSGRVFCWGLDREGQLGRGARDVTTGIPTAVEVGGEPFLATQVATASSSSCAIDTDGRLWCWGAAREVGSSAPTDPLVPTPVTSESSPSLENERFVELEAGRSSYCARSLTGRLWCWGSNEAGEVLGVPGGTPQDNARATVIDDAVELSLGNQHGCYRNDAGQVACWGSNMFGQLGQVLDGESLTARTVTALPKMKNLECAGLSCCALRDSPGQATDGEVWCWGRNNAQQLGRDTTDSFTVQPAPVEGKAANTTFTGVRSLAGQNESFCALADGVYCWGSNGFGGTAGAGIDNSTLLERVDTLLGNELLRDAASLYGGIYYGCAIRQSGELACWGADLYGEHAADRDAIVLEPAPVLREVVSLDSVVAASTGSEYGCALLANTVRCFGSNARLQLGRGPNAEFFPSVSFATDVAFPPEVDSVSAVGTGIDYACAVADGEPYCWGVEASFRIGSSGGNAASPRRVEIPTAFSSAVLALAVGSQHACVVVEGDTDTARGPAVCWGRNTSLQLGRPDQSNEPGVVTGGLVDFIDITAGDSHTCGLRANGQVWCWGSGSAVGNFTNPSAVPVRAGQLRDIVAVEAGSNHTCAIERNALDQRIVHCWGVGPSGELGNGQTATSPVPVSVPGIVDAASIAAGDGYTCVALRDGTVQCWGSGAHGALAGNFESSLTPRPVNGLDDVVSVHAGARLSRHTVAVRRDGTAVCWGSNLSGACGQRHQQLYPFARQALLGP